MNIKPIKNRVALVQLKNKKETESGIILQHGVEESIKSKVLAIGPDVKTVKVEETVIPDWGRTAHIKFGDVPVYIINEEDIIAVVE